MDVKSFITLGQDIAGNDVVTIFTSLKERLKHLIFFIKQLIVQLIHGCN
jgi:hypothetical protein